MEIEKCREQLATMVLNLKGTKVVPQTGQKLTGSLSEALLPEQ